MNLIVRGAFRKRQPNFALHHSVFTIHLKKIFLLSAFTFLLAACSFNPNVQGKGDSSIQGQWQQDSLPGQSKLLTYSLSAFRFDCDSFYITVNTVSKVNYGTDSCMNRGRWTEYIKGKYRRINDSLYLKGFYYTANGKLKEQADCFGYGVYEQLYTVSAQTDSVLMLKGPSLVVPLQLRLQKRTVCVPKPL